jgi:hypothetical protein
MKKVMAAGAVLAAMVGAAQAEELRISRPDEVVRYFNTETIGSVLTEMGAVWQQRIAPDGVPYIAASMAGEVTLNIVPTVCEENYTQCVGMNTIAFFWGVGFNHQTVTAFNQRYWFATAGVAPDGTAAYLSRYEIADYGIPRGNIAASIYNLKVLAKRFDDQLSTAGRTVALEGYADDLESRNLNTKGLTALAGFSAAQHLSGHERAMEQTTELIRVLLSDEGAPRNKVQNITAKD